ncbi:hypothetical protein OG539_26670 [Actinacidiphila glaucinigra]|uniref:hypothetical protein n=1 Tax=Actinacidiphila glaucinigra TaxID=235986 RepID=UPI002DDB0FF9|nr:hypothetical protein [Actinacidiphila glaucinigra]WSD60357.1 hypothetical protein OIE69_16235 [Actinacidiphila glaucinigra]
MTTRRTVLAAGAALLVAGCASRRPQERREAAEGPVRTDTAPLQRRFPLLRRLHRAHWLAYHLVAGNDGRSVPGPSDIRVVGLAALAEGRVAALTARRDFRPARLPVLPGRLAALLPADAGWLHGDSFDAEITADACSGSFFLSRSRGRVCFDSVNPVAAASTP